MQKNYHFSFVVPPSSVKWLWRGQVHFVQRSSKPADPGSLYMISIMIGAPHFRQFSTGSIRLSDLTILSGSMRMHKNTCSLPYLERLSISYPQKKFSKWIPSDYRLWPDHSHLTTVQWRRIPPSMRCASTSASRVNSDSFTHPMPSASVGASFPPMMMLPINE
jgi:hypothetical protein